MTELPQMTNAEARRIRKAMDTIEEAEAQIEKLQRKIKRCYTTTAKIFQRLSPKWPKS